MERSTLARRCRAGAGSWVVPAAAAATVALTALGCGYRHAVGPLRPAPEARQQARMTVLDDGTVVYTRDRLEISLRPVTDAELNRHFAGISDDGLRSANPYTYGNWQDPETQETPQRFTVFLLKIKNYEYPKVLVDPETIGLHTDLGRRHSPLTLRQLDGYYLAYATGYGGNAFRLYDQRRDLLRQTLYARQLVFSGQEHSGYLVFPTLHHDVTRLAVHLGPVVLRFDYRDEPLETETIEYAFERDTGRVYPGAAARGGGGAT